MTVVCDDIAYEELGNFYITTFEFAGRRWWSSEQCYQAQKFLNYGRIATIRVGDFGVLLDEGHSDRYPLQDNWIAHREEYMYLANKAKFSQSLTLKKLLIDTGHSPIYYLAASTFWGCNYAKTRGENVLGKILMRIRDELE